ncbi:Mitochondrial import inner membrane translocase subunit TIM14 [Euphorbia peplus]|nr:Mitochondrial import inner membrane translocase subunit TIM14 [Euphorbia peplus]
MHIWLANYEKSQLFHSFSSTLIGESEKSPANGGGMATPLITGLAVAAAAYAGRYSIQAWQAFKARPPTAKLRRFYEGGFQPVMNRREAALILGVRESTATDKVKEAHRRVMVANHPDAGGSHYLASKINEAKDLMLGRGKGSGSAF